MDPDAESPAARPPRRRGNRVLVVVFALVGATAALCWVLTVLDGPRNPVAVVEVWPSRPGADSRLVVMFSDHVLYTRPSSDPKTFETERALWKWTPPLLVIMAGACAGGFVGFLVGRVVHRCRSTYP